MYRGVPHGWGEKPTAHTSFAETTPTALSWLPYVPLPTFGLETIFQVPWTEVVAPGVGVANGDGVCVGVEMAVGTRVGVRVLLGAACTDGTEAPEVMPMTAMMSSRILNTNIDFLRYF